MATVAASCRSALGEQPLETAVGGEAGLTEREIVVLRLVAEGRSNREIGDRLHISQHTAANHVRSILMKTDCTNRTEAAAWALRRKLADDHRPARSSSGRS
jgi:DNA-binding CsgD family transcriptional regulator